MSNVTGAEEKENPSCLMNRSVAQFVHTTVFVEPRLHPKQCSKLWKANVDEVSGRVSGEGHLEVVILNF